MIKIKLPKTIDVEIKKLSKGKFFVSLVKLGVFTEVDSEQELNHMINDLIYTYYDVPKHLQKQFHYRSRDDEEYNKAKPFIIFSTPNFNPSYIQ